MTKHHHQSRAEQIDNKAHGVAPFHFVKTQSRGRNAVATNDSSTQARAHQMHHEKDGQAMENWLEAEQTIRNIV